MELASLFRLSGPSSFWIETRPGSRLCDLVSELFYYRLQNFSKTKTMYAGSLRSSGPISLLVWKWGERMLYIWNSNTRRLFSLLMYRKDWRMWQTRGLLMLVENLVCILRKLMAGKWYVLLIYIPSSFILYKSDSLSQWAVFSILLYSNKLVRPAG